MNTLRNLVALLPDPDEPVYFSDDAAAKLEAACDRFDAEWKRIFGECPKPVVPVDDDEPDPHAPAQTPRDDDGA